MSNDITQYNNHLVFSCVIQVQFVTKDVATGPERFELYHCHIQCGWNRTETIIIIFSVSCSPLIKTHGRVSAAKKAV